VLALGASVLAARADYKSTVLGDSPIGYWRFSETGGGTPSTNTWYHLMGTYDGTTAILYVNGAPATTGTSSAYTPNTTVPMGIGARGDNAFYFPGSVDEVVVYPSVLPADAAAAHYAAATTNAAGYAAQILASSPVGYWRLDEPFIPSPVAANSGTLGAAGDAGNYDVIVTNAYGALTSQVTALAVNPAVPPTISQQPAARLVYPGGNASFTVGAEGTTHFSYQWQHAGTNLPGATTATLWLANVDATMIGNYGVTVTNVAGKTASATASLILYTPPGQSYEAAVAGYGPAAYWRLGETSGDVAFDYAGGYDGLYTNVTQGSPGALAGDANLAATFDGTSSAVLIGNPAGLNFAGQISMVAWLKPNATDGLRKILAHGYQTSPNNAEVGMRVNAGAYDVWSSDGNNHGTSMAIPPEDIGTWVQLVGTYDGTTWRVYHNGVLAASAANAIGALVANPTGWAIGARGTGTERFFNGDLDEIAMFNKALTADQINTLCLIGHYGANCPPVITQQPPCATAIVGGTATFSAAAGGSVPLGYQWQRNGVNIAGATTSTLTIPNAYYTDAGSYTLVVANAVGSATSSPATLGVLPVPTFANLTNGLVLHLRFDGDYTDTSGRANDASAPARFRAGSPALR
jgi:hypothetical protein